MRLGNVEHPMYIYIKEGMIRKRGLDYPYLQEI